LAHPRIPKPLPITAIGTVIQGRNECITHLLREAGLLISDVKNYMRFLLKALEGCTSSSAFLRGEFDAAIHSLPKIKRVLGSLCPDSFSCRFSLYPFVDLMSFTNLTPLNTQGGTQCCVGTGFFNIPSEQIVLKESVYVPIW
jgi:hypothetical protein